MKKIIFLSLIVVVIIFLVMRFYSQFRHNIQNSLLNGFWRGFDTFCQNAELSMMLLYVGEYNSTDDIYSCHIIAINEHGFVLNDSFNMRLVPDNSYKLNNINTMLYKAQLEGVNYPHFPAIQYVEFDPRGTMRFFVGDTMYANMYRDCSMNQHEHSEKIKEYQRKKNKGMNVELPGSDIPDNMENTDENVVDREEDVDTIQAE